MSPRYLVIDGKVHLWRDLLELRREQLRARIRDRQLTLFELREDARPPSERTASGRFQEPTLFTLLDDPRRCS